MKTSLLLGLILCSILLNGQSIPYAVNYQAIARDAEGLPIPNATIDAEIKILKGSQNGQNVLTEQHLTSTNAFGLYFFSVGEGNGNDNLSDIDWSSDDYFIETIISIDGGTELRSVAKLNSVPYSFLSYRSVIDEVDDADNDNQNELQDLGLNGTELTITDGKSVDLFDLVSGNWAGDDQILLDFRLIDNTLSLEIEDGNTISVDLSALTGGGNGSDDQILTLNGTELIISNGNSIDLSGIFPPGGSDDQQIIDFSLNGTVLSLTLEDGGTETIDLNSLAGNGSGIETVTTLIDNNDGSFSYISEDGTVTTLDHKDILTILTFDDITNQLNYIDENGEVNVIDLNDLVSVYSNENSGAFTNVIGIHTSGDGTVAQVEETVTNLVFNMFTNELVYIDEENITNTIDLGPLLSVVTNLNEGHLISTHTSGDGIVTNIEESITQIVDNNDGTFTYTNENGDQNIVAKNIIDDHPDDESKLIRYASLEGPETAVFERGTARLSNGECIINFSDHFQHLINANTITVQLTPHSAETYGLAAIEKNKFGITVKELMNGHSDFTFDWEVKAVREGYEKFKAVIDRSDLQK